jgi:integrase
MTRKRANGEGTIYKRADGRYEGAAVVPIVGGGRRRVRVYGKTRKEARDRLDKVIDAAKAGVPRPQTRQRLSEYLDYWLEHVVKPELRASTYAGYETMVRQHIKPALGRKYLDALTPIDVRRFVTELRIKHTDGRGGGPRVLSPRMVQFAHAVLRNALSSAAREELVTRNVAKLVRVSTPHYEVGQGLDPVTARTFLASIREDRLYALYLCAVILGLRRSELLGLAWSAIDLNTGRLSVRQTLTVVNGRLSFQAPKTQTSRRTVPLPAVVVEELRAHQQRQKVERQNASDRWQESGLVFTTPDGRPIPPSTLGKQWRDLRERVGLGKLRFHDLRHTCVSLLLALGVAPHIVREIAGHSDIKVTMTVYAHGNLDEHTAALARLGAVIDSTLPSTVAVNETTEEDQDRGNVG